MTFLNRLSTSSTVRVQITDAFAGTPVFHDALAYDDTDSTAMDKLAVDYAGTLAFYHAGIGFTAAGNMLIVDASAGLPSDTFWQSGLPISAAQSRLCVDPTGAVVYAHQGVPFTAVGAVAVDGGTPSDCSSPTTIFTKAFDSIGSGSPSWLSYLGTTAKSYQSFSFAGGAMVTDLHWTGAKGATAEPFPIVAWLVQVWNDNAGAPGTLAQAMVFSPALANETSIGSFGGVDCYTYSVDFLPWFLADVGVSYWVSVQPDTQSGNAPAWYWATSAAAGSSYLILDGTPVSNAFPLALDITGCVGTPTGSFRVTSAGDTRTTSGGDSRVYV